MEEAVMCDEDVMGSEPLSIREQMINAAERYLGSTVDLPEICPMKELVIKLEPCDILVTAPFVNNPYIPPPRIQNARRQPTIPPKPHLQTEKLKMLQCEVLGCEFRTPKSAMLEKHMTYHLNESFVATKSKNLKEKLKPEPVKSECKTEKPSGSKMQVSESIGDVFKNITSKICMTPATETSLVSSYLTAGTNQTRSDMIKKEDIANHEVAQPKPIFKSESDARISNKPCGAVLGQTVDLKDITDNSRIPDYEMFDEISDTADPVYNPESDNPRYRSHDLISDKQTTPKRNKLDKRKLTRKFFYRCTDCSFTTKRWQELTGHAMRCGHGGTFIVCEVQTVQPNLAGGSNAECKKKDRQDVNHLYSDLMTQNTTHQTDKELEGTAGNPITNDSNPFAAEPIQVLGKKELKRRRDYQAWKVSKNRKIYTCEVCPYTTPNSGSMNYHRNSHTEKSHFCTHSSCDFKTAYPQHLKIHLRKHTGVKPHLCEICGKSFFLPTMLKRHKYTHGIDVVLHKCDLCDYTSHSKKQVTRHKFTHTGEKPFKCTQCSYATSQKFNLVSHNRIHSGEKPYKCKYCDYEAAHKSSMNSHVKCKHPSGSSSMEQPD